MKLRVYPPCHAAIDKHCTRIYILAHTYKANQSISWFLEEATEEPTGEGSAAAASSDDGGGGFTASTAAIAVGVVAAVAIGTIVAAVYYTVQQGKKITNVNDLVLIY